MSELFGKASEETTAVAGLSLGGGINGAQIAGESGLGASSQ
jgi:hypothetical protein